MDQNDMADNGLPFRQVTKVETGVYPSARISFISLSCFHCADAPCIHACPEKALFRNDALGVVEIHPERCIGCHVCAMVCPFGAPRFLPGEKMQKCNPPGKRPGLRKNLSHPRARIWDSGGAFTEKGGQGRLENSEIIGK
jgi:Fe-S-cluster-containing dehydrogenase component